MKEGMVFAHLMELHAHLRSHEAVRDIIFLEVIVDRIQVKAHILRDYVQTGSCSQSRIHIHHTRIKTEAGVTGDLVLRFQVIVAPVPATKRSQVLMLKHDSFRLAGGA